MKKRYLITPHNSTVNGDPGRHYDWSKFDWEGGTLYRGPYFVTEKPYLSPKPYMDDFFIAEHCQYLHVGYDFAETGCVFRVRPNDSMWPPHSYYGRQVKEQRAVKGEDGNWYWELEFVE